MVRPLAAATAALLLASCGSSITLPIDSPAPADLGSTSPAANLRVQTDLLFGEHAAVIGKLAVAAAAGRKEEFHSYAAVLAANGGDLTALLRSALGETAGTHFGEVWTAGNSYLVDYIVAAVTHDEAKTSAAAAGLTGPFSLQLSLWLQSSLALSTNQATEVATDQVSTLKVVVDDAVASAFSSLYPDLREAYAKSVRGGDLISGTIANRFADRFPGGGKTKAADFRAILDTLLQDQAYLITMATDATVAGTQAEIDAAGAAVAQSTGSITTVFGGAFGSTGAAQLKQLWDGEAALLTAYAKTGDAGTRANLLSAAAAPSEAQVFGPALTAPLTATVQVVEDQRAKSLDKLAVDDRAAAQLMAAAGDLITASAVNQAPAKLS